MLKSTCILHQYSFRYSCVSHTMENFIQETLELRVFSYTQYGNFIKETLELYFFLHRHLPHMEA